MSACIFLFVQEKKKKVFSLFKFFLIKKIKEIKKKELLFYFVVHRELFKKSSKAKKLIYARRVNLFLKEYFLNK
jgi:hypothetical protein